MTDIQETTDFSSFYSPNTLVFLIFLIKRLKLPKQALNLICSLG